jgi:hypothetical protein
MDHGIYLLVCKHTIQQVGIPHITVIVLGAQSAEAVDTFEDALFAVNQIVQQDGGHPGSDKLQAGMTTYVTSSTCHEYLQHESLLGARFYWVLFSVIAFPYSALVNKVLEDASPFDVIFVTFFTAMSMRMDKGVCKWITQRDARIDRMLSLLI